MSTMQTKTATFIKSVHVGRTGAEQKLYRLDPPLDVTRWDYSGDEAEEKTHSVEFVIVSAVVVPYSGPETYIFAATESGKVADWMELQGSYRGGLDHEKALRGAGYEVAA